MGGAIFSMYGSLTVINSTLAGNFALGGAGNQGGAGYGGAVFNLDGAVTVLDSTLAANTVASGASSATGVQGVPSGGGAVYNLAFGIAGGAATASLTLANSILAGDTVGVDLASLAVNGVNANTATVTATGPNLVGSFAATITGPAPLAGNPLLGPLQNNGGLSPTMALLHGSPALDAGSNAVAGAAGLSTDQRGPGFPRVVGAAVDLGAFEAPPGGSAGGGTILNPSFAPVFAVLADHSLWEDATTDSQELSPAGTILSISAVTDHAGQDDVFAITADNHLWEHTPTGWSMLSIGSFQQISAAANKSGNAIVFGVLADNSLWEYSSLFPAATGYWAMLSPGGTILSVSAVTDSAGNDVAFAVTADTNLWEHTPTAWSLLSAGTFSGVSAGLNGAGQAVAYGVLADNSLWEYNPALGGLGWRNLSPAGTVLGASAAGADQVFAITADHHLWRDTPKLFSNNWSQTSTGSFAGLSSSAGNGTPGVVFPVLFAVLSDGSLWQYTTSWTLLDSAGVLAVAAPRRA